MADIAFGGLKNIVEIVEKVQDAVEKVKRNKKECCDIETYLTVCSNVLLELQEKTEIMKRKDICKALLKVQGSFNEALTLVLECQLVHGVSISCWGYIRNLWKAGDWEKDLSKVKEDIGSHMRLAHLAAEAHISIQLQQLFTGKKGSSSSYLTLPPARTQPPPNDQLRPVTVGRGGLKVVLLYAFDCTDYTPAWFKMEEEVFWLVHEKLADFPGSWLGYIYVMSKPNTYTCDMKLVDPADTKATGYRASSLWHRKSCTENMACGLTLAHELISDDDGDSKGIILLFSDGSIHNKGNFFDGAEKFKSKVPVHTFTLGGNNAYDEGLRCIAANSHGGTFNPSPVPDKQMLSSPFSNLLDSILGRTKNPSGRGGLKVVVLYAFDCTDSTPDWYKMEKVFWAVHEKLVHLDGSWLGYIYVMSKPNTYTCDMKLVDSADKEATGYHSSSFWHRRSCTPDMASGLKLAHELISHDGDSKGIILLFSDGSIDNKGDFFDGAEKFKSEVPVHTFTLGGAAYNEGLSCIAANSHGGTFDPSPVPAEPKQSPFSDLLDSILSGSMNGSGRASPLDVVLVYGFDCTSSTPNWYKMDKIFWLVHAKLTHFLDSRLGYIYVMSTPNKYTSDMKLVDSTETEATGYKGSSLWHRDSCTEDMASGLKEAQKLISYREHSNGIILLFSDGSINKGDFFDGAEKFKSKFPVHTFTLGGDAYNEGLRCIARNSQGGKFDPRPVPDKPNMSPFSDLLDSILGGTMDASDGGGVVAFAEDY